MPSERFRHWAAARVHAVCGTAVETGTPWHDHDHLVLGLVDRGVRVIELRNGRLDVGAGQGFVLPPHVVHRCLHSGSVDYRILCLDAPVSPAARLNCGIVTALGWRTAFDRALILAATGEDTLAEALTVLTGLTVPIASLAEPMTIVEPKAVRQVRRDLLADLAERKTLRDLANGAGLSPFHLQRLYTRTTGLSPRQQQMLERLRQVRKLLHGGTALNAAAAACGFSDQSHLNRIFKRLMGIPPGQYLAQIRAHHLNCRAIGRRPSALAEFGWYCGHTAITRSL